VKEPAGREAAVRPGPVAWVFEATHPAARDGAACEADDDQASRSTPRSTSRSTPRSTPHGARDGAACEADEAEAGEARQRQEAGARLAASAARPPDLCKDAAEATPSQAESSRVKSSKELKSATEATPRDAPRHPWLEGVEVLDLANVIAGPTIGATLARFGAVVTKLDPVVPTYSPDVTVLYGLAANAGKNSILLNIADEAEGGGRAAFEKLVARSDVLIANATRASLARLRCSPDELAALNPTLVLCRFDAWGGPSETGPRDGHLGYDDNVQAALGIMERFGGGLGRVEEHAHIGTVDVIAGVGGALATVAALYHREMRKYRGAGSPGVLIARASLAALGQCVQYPFCCGMPSELAAEGNTSATTLGPRCRGVHSLLRCYEAADGEWFLLHASLHPHPIDTRWALTPPKSRIGHPTSQAIAALRQLESTHPALRLAIQRAHGAAKEAEEADGLGNALEAAFKSAGLSAAMWVSRLRSHGIVGVVLSSLTHLRARHATTSFALHGPSFQFLTDAHHPAGSALTYFAPLAIRPTATPLVAPLRHAPRYGEHTRQVLAAVGVEVAPLFSRGVASDGWSTAYLPGCPPSPAGPCTRSRRADEAAPLTASAAASAASAAASAASIAAASASTAASCPVCLEPIGDKHVELGCSHALCQGCANKCADAGHRHCPVCREPHLLHPSRLAQRSKAWRRQYAAWRGGRSAGASGELSAIRTPSSLEELLSRSHGGGGSLLGVGHLVSCGDLHYPTGRTKPAAAMVQWAGSKTRAGSPPGAASKGGTLPKVISAPSLVGFEPPVLYPLSQDRPALNSRSEGAGRAL